MSDKQSGSSGAFIGGFLIGAAVGALTGLLFAPKSGRETRQILKKSADALPELAEDLSSTIQIQADRLSETAVRNWDGTLTRLKDAIAAGVEASKREQAQNANAANATVSMVNPAPSSSSPDPSLQD